MIRALALAKRLTSPTADAYQLDLNYILAGIDRLSHSRRHHPTQHRSTHAKLIRLSCCPDREASGVTGVTEVTYRRLPNVNLY